MKAPSAPDPKKTADAQAQMNKETAIANYGLNATNQVTPQGSLTYQQIGTWSDGTPRYQATQSYSPEQQKIYDQSTQLQQQLGNIANQQASAIGAHLSKPLDMSGIPKGGDASMVKPVDFSADRQKVEDALMGRLNPQLDRDRASLEADLLAKGVRVGSEAYDNAMQNFGQQSNDARTAAILAGGQEQSRLADLAYRDQQALFNNQNAQRAQALNEVYAARNQPINEISALMSGAQVTNPNFVSTPGSNIANTDYAGLVNQKYQSDMANYQSKMGGLFGLGGALIGALPTSDRRLKTDIKRVGTLDNGLAVYSYRYVSGGPTQIGVMADEVEQIMPDAVFLHDDGFRRVNYARAVEVA